MPKRAEASFTLELDLPVLGNNSMGNRCANFTEYCRDALGGEIEQVIFKVAEHEKVAVALCRQVPKYGR
jgi:hypothetical protein